MFPINQRARGARKSAFTLVEILVVVAIIALLAAILFPVFGRARDKARQATCTSNLKQIYLGLRQYASDYDGSYPARARIGNSAYRHISDPQGFPQLLDPYIKSEQIWYCPSMLDSMKEQGYPGYAWVTSANYLFRPDLEEDANLAIQFLVYDNYIFKTPTPVGATSAPTQWLSSERRQCNHAGQRNFLYLGFDGRVRLYPLQFINAACRL